MKLATVTNITPLTLRELAQDALEKAGGNVQSATEELQERIEKSERLFLDLMKPLVHQATYALVSSCMRETRRSVWTAPNYTATGNGDRLRASANCLMDFQLPGASGCFLRDAYAKQIQDAIHCYETLSNDMSHKARWLKAILKKIGSKKVSSVLDESTLRDLQEQTK